MVDTAHEIDLHPLIRLVPRVALGLVVGLGTSITVLLAALLWSGVLVW